MMDLQPLTSTESTPDTHDFGRELAIDFARPETRAGVDSLVDQLNAMIADEMFTA